MLEVVKKLKSTATECIVNVEKVNAKFGVIVPRSIVLRLSFAAKCMGYECKNNVRKVEPAAMIYKERCEKNICK